MRSGPFIGNLYILFFQAEDGIRDYKVTGVQTCALPIFGDGGSQNPSLTLNMFVNNSGAMEDGEATYHDIDMVITGAIDTNHNGFMDGGETFDKIGRASCRERV